MNYHRETISSSSSGSEPWAPSHHHQQSLLANHMKEEISDYNSFLKLLMTEINAEDSLSQNLISLDRNFSSTHHHQQLPELSGADHHHQSLQANNYNSYNDYMNYLRNNIDHVSTPTSRSLLYSSSNYANNSFVLRSELSSTYDHDNDDTGRNSSRQLSSSFAQRNLGGLNIRSGETSAIFMKSERDGSSITPSKRSCTKLVGILYFPPTFFVIYMYIHLYINT